MKKFFLMISVFLGLMAFVLPAEATILTFGLDFEFSEGEEPEGTAPWLTATFDDEANAEGVTLTMEASNLIEDEYIKLWCFNFDPLLTLSDLAITYIDGNNGVVYTSPSETEYKADGGGYFDIEFQFPTSNSEEDPDDPNYDPDEDRFMADESSVWIITSEKEITADSFNYLSEVSGGHGTWVTAAHVGAIDIIGDDNDGSGWVGATVPEPSTMLLLGFGLIGIAVVGRKKSQTS